MKKRLAFLMVALLTFSTNASELKKKGLELNSKYSGRNDIVMVVYYTSGNPHSVMANVKNAMHTRDPGGFMNPYWIVNFKESEVEKSTGCGLVVGEWYSSNYRERGNWESIMNEKLARITSNSIYMYMKDGVWTPTENQLSQMEAIKNICL